MKPRVLGLATLVLVLSLSRSHLAGKPRPEGGADSPDEPGPTVAETLMLEYINRARKDPSAEAKRIRKAAQETPAWAYWINAVDWDLYEEEMSKIAPAPPLVYNLVLAQAARRHSAYLGLHHRRGDGILAHKEVAGKEGFVAVSAQGRATAAGYMGLAAENIHCRMSVDIGSGEASGMRPGRGHRKIMHDPTAYEYGLGVVLSPDRALATHLFGERGGLRLAGGVAYEDRNGNGFYDAGEGVGGVRIGMTGGGHAVTWPTGAWAADVPPRGDVRLTATWGDLTFSRAWPEGARTVKFDVVRASERVIQSIDRLIKKIESACSRGKPGAKGFALALELDAEAQGVPLDDARRACVDKLAQDTRKDLRLAQSAVRKALQEGPPGTVLSQVQSLASAYRRTVAKAWFTDATECARAFDKYGKLLEPGKSDARRRQRAAEAVGKITAGVKTDEWRNYLTSLASRMIR
jgi:Cysteine-rich secretory protein family